MAIAPRAPGDYAPAAGARAVETRFRLRPSRWPGARVLHVSAAGAEGAPARAGRLGSSPPGPASRCTGGCCSGRRSCARRWPRSGPACAARERHRRRGVEHFIDSDARRPQPRGLRRGRAPRPRARPGRGDRGARVWHCHDDASRAEPGALARAAPLTARCAQVLVCTRRSRRRGSPAYLVTAVAPGIDPLDPRNIELEPRLPGRVVRPLGIDLERPFCLQVLALDRCDDPQP